MPIFHQQTKHSYMSVRKNAHFLDWQSQPTNHKLYPHFNQRFKIEEYEELTDLNLIGGITFEKSYPDGVYHLRSVPSAGGLFPFEVYIQVRGIKGLLDGIYHYEPHRASLTLLQEIGRDGVEHYFKDSLKQKGLVFLISSVYFRSSWKYNDRAIRYILLDVGHQLGAIYTALSLMGRENEFVFDFDKLSLNEVFGFRDDEMFMCSVRSSEASETSIDKLRQGLPFVSGCDYLETNRFIEDAYKQSAVYEEPNFNPPNFFENIPKEQLRQAIVNRRSIRAFRAQPMSDEEFWFIMGGLFQFAKEHAIDIYYTANLVTNMSQGLYKNGELLEEGDFRSKSRYLALEQNLGGQSGVTFFFTSNEAKKYQKVNILSGFLAHIIYIRSELMGIGCSGIGAYYDDECKEFLQTKNNILYLLAIGR
ncbi:SagB family peptide dehydrogenase [Sulfurimonas sp. C5]|uniref:SagB family peptide dehydrogenase n=1 Tax=Sulfurimonas sp. C5 TaxID=3036947 RepID=UPI0024574B37|nr:SagB family peptide dehydrogenase [Sulfurimonas sp. C5]MDH4945291.1 SagB family peptide dehydrogenase [Sulfurimonas sp. C5]